MAVPLPALAALFEALMLLYWCFDRKHREIGRINLGIAFPEMPDGEARRIVRRVYLRMGTSAAEFIHLPRMDRRYIESHFRIEGEEHLVRSLAETGQGCFVVTGHFGNWEFLSHAHAVLTFPVSIIVRPLNDPVVDRLVMERREHGGTVVIRKAESARAMLAAIRRGRAVGILIDQNVDRHKGVLVDFFTRKAYTTDGVARLALGLKANVHAAYIFREEGRRFHHVIRIGPLIPMDPGAPREEEVLRLTRRCNEELEQAIRSSPEQWFWLHRRWKTRPPGETPIYPR